MRHPRPSCLRLYLGRSLPGSGIKSRYWNLHAAWTTPGTIYKIELFVLGLPSREEGLCDTALAAMLLLRGRSHAAARIMHENAMRAAAV